jgi:hypothetical protein
MNTLAVSVQPTEEDTVTIYIVLEPGIAVGLAIFGLLSPAVGLQLYATPPAALKFVLAPRQMLKSLAVAVAIGAGFTVMVTCAGEVQPLEPVTVTV